MFFVGTSQINARQASGPHQDYEMWSGVTENEELDRKGLELPGVQEDLIKVLTSVLLCSHIRAYTTP